MPGSFNFHRSGFALRSVLQLLIAAVMAVPLSSTTVAQSDVPPVPDMVVPDLPDNVTDLSAGASTPAIDISTETTPVLPAPGYWIVSTAASPQSFDECRPMFRPVVTRFDDCIGYRRSHISELQQSLIPGVPVCIVVHGSFMDPPSIAPESRATWNWLRNGRRDLPLQVIYLSWPSDETLAGLIGLNVTRLGDRAGRNGFYLASLVQMLPPESPLCLLGHSHGSRVIASSLHLMGGGVVEGYRHSCANCLGRQIRVVFAAAAIDHDWFNPGQRYDRALCCTQCLLNLRNARDPALCVYPLSRLGAARALGKSGFTSRDRMRLQACSCKVTDLDVTAEIGCAHMFPEYFCRPWIAYQISNFVFAPEQ